jgi:hypothetical protein
MDFVMELWKPILLSGLAVFILSAMAWTVLPHHRKEYGRMANEDGIADAIRAGNIAPGLYSIPHAGDMKEMGTPEMKAKMERGPNAFIAIVKSGNRGMGPMMIQSFITNIIIATFIAYIASKALPTGAEYMTVFCLVATATFMAYGLGTIPDSIWFGKPWRSYALNAADSLAYALVTGGIFGWLWV